MKTGMTSSSMVGVHIARSGGAGPDGRSKRRQGARQCPWLRGRLACRRSVVLLTLPVFVALMPVFPADATAQCIDYPRFLRWVSSTSPFGSANDVALSNGYALVAGYSGLTIYDVSIPTSPRRRADLGLPGSRGERVAVAGSTACVVGEGLWIVDVSTPSSPTMLASMPELTFANGVAISGQYAYVTDYYAGLNVVDISVPTAPFVRSVLDIATPENVAVDVTGRHAYVTCRTGGLQIVDVSDPARPTVVGHHDAFATDVALSGDLAYVSEVHLGLEILDVSVPSLPVLLGIAPIAGQPTQLVVEDAIAYVASDYSDPRFDHYGLEVVDVSDPAAPFSLGRLASPCYAIGIAVGGGYAYVADGCSLEIADVSNPNRPPSLGSTPIPGNHVNDLAVDGSLACALTRNDVGTTLAVFDLSPLPPVLVSNMDLGGAAIVLAGRYAYACGDEFLVLDLADPAQPAVVGRTGAPGIDMAVKPGYALVAQQAGGLQIVDITDPLAPQLAGRIDVPARCVAVAGDHACVSNFGSEVQVIDISDPLTPTLAGTAAVRDRALAIAMVGDLVYVADRYSGLTIIDISTPSAPTIIGRVDTPDYASDVVVAGAFTYVGEEGAGLEVVESWLPDRPRIIGSWSPTGGTSGYRRIVATDGVHLGVVDEQMLVILGNQCPLTPAEIAGFTAVPDDRGILLSWETSGEQDLLGFLLHRSTAEEEIGVQLTPNLLMAGPTSSFRDAEVISGRVYYYRLEARDRSGGGRFFGPVAAMVEPALGPPGGERLASLAWSEPNPFMPDDDAVTIRFTIPRQSRASLVIFDVQGRLVRRLVDGVVEAGPRTARWDGRNESGERVAAGVYLSRLTTEGFQGSRHIVRIR